jgi:tetratricopeptide (TPR) repeat protein
MIKKVVGFTIITLFVLLFASRADTVNVQKSTEKIEAIKATVTPSSLPGAFLIRNNYHIFQSFNNCGPASLSMLLSYYGKKVGQDELGQALRPFQNSQGDNDDKSVTFAELAKVAEEYNLITYHRPNGSIRMLKALIAEGLPVLTRTWLERNENIGHYRVVKGYNNERQIVIQDDSLQGANLKYSYSDFNDLWEKFSYEYLVLVPHEKDETVRKILADEVNPKVAWRKTAERLENQLKVEPENQIVRFNYSIALYHLQKFEQSVDEFEKIESALPFRTLWYQIEPIQAYYELGNFSKVFEITDNIINNQNRAFAELYYLRGKVYKKLGESNAAKTEFEKAVYYNINYKEAKDELLALE